MRVIRLLTYFLMMTAAVAAIAQQPALTLPRAFGGWVRTGTTAEAQLSAERQALLHEFQLRATAVGRYQQNGRKLELTVYSFPDVTDAYGAFTFTHPAQVAAAKIGDGAVSSEDEVVFFRGNILVEAKIERMNAMTLSQLRELSAALPVARDAGSLPTAQKYLPQQGYVEGSLRYVIGPVGLARAGAPVNAEQVNFDVSPEVVVGHYSAAAPPVILTLISYPTPQIAAAQMHKIEAGLSDSQMKRTHSILAIASGPLTQDDAKALLASVNYDATVTWDEPTKQSPRDDLYSLLWNITLLSAILVAFMLLIGFFFGGFRLLYYRMYPERAERHEQKQQLIRLNLS